MRSEDEEARYSKNSEMLSKKTDFWKKLDGKQFKTGEIWFQCELTDVRKFEKDQMEPVLRTVLI